MIFYSSWLNLSISVRHQIAQDFGILKKSPTHVQDNVVVNDGYVIQDVENALSIENIQNHLGVGKQEENLDILWVMLIDSYTKPHESNVSTDVPVISIPKEIKKKAGRPAGAKNKKSNEKATKNQ